MITKLIARVTSEGKLEIPPEILQQLQPLTEYEISVTENEIKLTKTQKKLSLDELFQRIDEIDKLEPDPNQPSLEEISEIVKEVRQELWGK